LGIGSTATDKTVPREERESGHREERKRGGGGHRQAAAGGDDFDDDFETVTDKKQVRGGKKNFDPDTAFNKNRNSDKPSFSRGGAAKR